MIYDSKVSICEKYPRIKTLTSGVYDYFIDSDINKIATNHACLPIWFGQEQELTDKVLNEL